LFNELIDIIINVDALLTLLQNTITRDYQESRTIIDLIFTTNNIVNRLIQYEIDKDIKNLFRLFIDANNYRLENI